MRSAFIDICREPDYVLFQYADSTVRFEEPDSLALHQINGRI